MAREMLFILPTCEEAMKKLFTLFLFVVLALMSLACANRALNQPVTPNMGVGASTAATPTP